ARHHQGRTCVSYLWTMDAAPRGAIMTAVTSPSEDQCPMSEEVDLSSTTLEAELEKRKRAECMAFVQKHTVQLALELLVREPDVNGFFRGFIQMLIEQGENNACGVFL